MNPPPYTNTNEHGDSFSTEGQSTSYHQWVARRRADFDAQFPAVAALGETEREERFTRFLEETTVGGDTDTFPLDSRWEIPVIEAIFNNNRPQLEALIQAGQTNLNAYMTRFEGGFKPIHLATAKDSPEMIELLIRNGADVNSGMALTGKTALLIAAERNNIKTVSTLLRYGADPTLTDDRGRSPIDFAKQNKNTEMLLAFCETP